MQVSHKCLLEGHGWRHARPWVGRSGDEGLQVVPAFGDQREVEVLRRRGGIDEVEEAGEEPFVEPFVDGEEELLLAAEVLVDRAARAAGRIGDLVQGGAFEATRREDLLARLSVRPPLPSPW